MKHLSGVLILLLAGLPAPISAHDASAPLPPPRPAGMNVAPAPPVRPSDLQTATPAPASVQDARAIEDPVCARALASGRMVAASAAPVAGPGGCGVAAPVKLQAIVLADGGRVTMEPQPLIRCDLAEALADWVREDIAPLADKAGGALSAILGSDGYECRGRNGVAGATLSEHGKGDAFDLRGVRLKDGRTLLVERQSEARDFMEQVRRTGCLRFATVLGPGSDGFHENHMHVDMDVRRNGYRICQWDLK